MSLPIKNPLIKKKSLKLFHVLMGTTDTKALNLFNNKSLNLMLPASMMTFDSRWKKNLPLMQEKKKMFFADSGMIGWIKKIRNNAWEYAKNPEKVLNLQLQINPDIIAHVDIPCELQILEMLGRSKKQALQQTIKNALWLIEKKESGDPKLKNKIIAIGIQGDTLDDYHYCLDSYRDKNLDELDPKKYWFAIGSVCMRKPPDLYEIAQFIRQAIPPQFHIHCYGIANLPWMLQLEHIGIDSCDSATANMAAAMFRLIDEGGKRSKINLTIRDTNMKAGMFAFNIASYEFQLKNRMYPIMEELFFDNSEQMEFDL